MRPANGLAVAYRNDATRAAPAGREPPRATAQPVPRRAARHPTEKVRSPAPLGAVFETRPWALLRMRFFLI